MRASYVGRMTSAISNKIGFSPNLISQGALWLDAADLNSITKDGSNNVSQWTDKFGNSNATQGTGANQPVYTANILNNKPIIRFGGNDFLNLASAIHTLTNNNNTCFVVANTTTTNATQRLLSMSEAGSSRYNLQFDSTVGQISFQSRNAFGSAVSIGSMTETNFNIIRGRRAGTTQAITFNAGTEQTNASGADESGIDAATIGAFTDGTTNPLTGDIAEIIIYEKSLSESEIRSVEQYLSLKWGIQI